jgi:hypothetical protein
MLLIVSLLITLINASIHVWPEEIVKISNSILRPVIRERMNYEFNKTNRLFPEYEGLYIPNYDFDFNYFMSEFLENNVIDLDSLINNKTLGSQLMYQDYQLSKFYRRYGYRYLFRIKRGAKLKNILNRGKNCYNINKCSKVEYSEFRSCIKETDSCYNTHLVYPRILIESLTRLTHLTTDEFVYIYGRTRSEFKHDYPFDM